MLISNLVQAYKTGIGHETLSKVWKYSMTRGATKYSESALTHWLHAQVTRNGAAGYSLEVNFDQFQEVCTNSELSMALEMAPTEAISCLGAAAYEVSHPLTSLRGAKE